MKGSGHPGRERSTLMGSVKAFWEEEREEGPGRFGQVDKVMLQAGGAERATPRRWERQACDTYTGEACWGRGRGQIIKGLSAILRDKCFSKVRNHEGTHTRSRHTHTQAALSSQAPGRTY